jgi:uncharacterized protein with HEPN domain
LSRSYRAYLQDMRDCIVKILDYTTGYEYSRFAKDTKTIDAVVRNIEIIGEASKHLPDNIKELDSQIPWKAIAGMRDKLVHDYFGVDIRFVWNTVKEDIPFLNDKIVNLLDQVEE